MKFCITGASSGIGYHCAQAQLQAGHTVLGVSRRQMITHPRYIPWAIDFADVDSLERDAKNLTKHHPDIDVLIHCAGYGQFAALEQWSMAQIHRMMQVNFLSPVALTKVLLPALKRRAQGKIIFIGSESAMQGQKNGSIYCASKFALRGFAQSLRQEAQTAGMAVTIIQPGLVSTPFFDDLSFAPGDANGNAIQVEDLVAMINMVVAMVNHCVVEELICQPLKKVWVKKNREQ